MLRIAKQGLCNLTTIGGPVPQRLINQSHYQEILLLQRFDGGTVLKPKKSASNLKKQNKAVF